MHAYAHYAALYERSLRAIKGWVEDGRRATPAAPPPLDQPREMLAWWHRVKTNRPPDILVRLAAGAKTASATPAAAVVSAAQSAPLDPLPAAATPAATGVQATAADPKQPATTSAPSLSTSFLGGAAVGFGAVLNRLRVAEANQGELHASLVRDAIAATDAETKLRLQAAAERAQSKWNEMIGELRKAEAAAPKILAEAGKSWDSDSVLVTLETFHLVQKSSLVGLVRRVRPMLKGCANDLEQEALWQRELDAIFAMWSPEQFIARVTAP